MPGIKRNYMLSCTKYTKVICKCYDLGVPLEYFLRGDIIIAKLGGAMD